MIKWMLPLACALTLTACGTSGPMSSQGGTYDSSGGVSSGSTTSGTTSSTTSGASDTSGAMSGTDREPGSISAAPHIDPDNPAAGATTGNSVTDVTGEGAAPDSDSSGTSSTGSTSGSMR